MSDDETHRWWTGAQWISAEEQQEVANFAKQHRVSQNGPAGLSRKKAGAAERKKRKEGHAKKSTSRQSKEVPKNAVIVADPGPARNP